MRKDKKERHKKLLGIIEKFLGEEECEHVRCFEGFRWVVLPQTKWTELMGVSDRTFRELAKVSPVVSTKTVNGNGKPIAYYRLGSVHHNSVRHIANIMAKMYRKKYELERLSRRNWGCLVGLAEAWPADAQVDIFRSVITDFEAFIGWVKGADAECPYANRYYQWLPLTLLRKYHELAIEFHIAKIQEKGDEPPDSIKQMHPWLWPKLAEL